MGSEGKYAVDTWERRFSLIKGRLSKKKKKLPALHMGAHDSQCSSHVLTLRELPREWQRSQHRALLLSSFTNQFWNGLCPGFLCGTIKYPYSLSQTWVFCYLQLYIYMDFLARHHCSLMLVPLVSFHHPAPALILPSTLDIHCEPSIAPILICFGL